MAGRGILWRLHVMLRRTYRLRQRLRLTAGQTRWVSRFRGMARVAVKGAGYGPQALPAHAVGVSEVDVLLYCPVAPAGLTVQATQVARIFAKHGISFQLTYYVPPEWPEHPLAQYWVPKSRIARPGLMIFMERVDISLPFFHETPRVMYTNLDWLKAQDFPWARQYMEVVLHPVEYRLDFIRESFVNARTHLLKWPPVSRIEAISEEETLRLESRGVINILYVGNDYDSASRKHPREVVSAILGTRNSQLRFWLKFRSSLPALVERRLRAAPQVEYLNTELVSDQEMEELYQKADINLIPNASEGNGLSIIEAAAKGVVPAVLDGYPMKTVIDDSCGYLIPCIELGPKCEGIEYRVHEKTLEAFLDDITLEGISKRRFGLQALQAELIGRESNLEATLLGLANSQRLPGATPPSPRVIEEARRRYWKEPSLIDVYVSTFQRAHHLAYTLPALMQACDASPYEHRVTVLVDALDEATYAVLQAYVGKVNVIATTSQRGLPFLFNMLHDHHQNQAARTERRPDFVNYIQDDCLIQHPESFFETLVECYAHFDAGQPVGYVSGYYTRVHPGFEKTQYQSLTAVLSDSIDGKQFLAPTRVLERVGKLTWYFKDGMRRGNPGPSRGSHFDLWQWDESPYSTTKQGLVNVILPGLCTHIADRPEQSTWDNDTTDNRVDARIHEGRVYRTRKGDVQVSQEEFFTPPAEKG